MGKQEAILCNKQKNAVKCIINDGLVTAIEDIYDKEALPLCLQTNLTVDSINAWLSKRKMPKNREGLKEAMTTFGSKYYRNYGRMFSLTDQYWFKLRKSDSWRKFNYFTNSYSSAIGQSLFAPWEQFEDSELRPESPDMTTNGVCRKVWVQSSNFTSYLIKAGSKVFSQEPISEVLASMTLQKINIIPFVKYDLCVNNLRICSKCKNFVTQYTEFVPAQSIYDMEPRRSDRSQYSHLINMCEKYGLKNPRSFIDKMLLCDYLIGNTDRHLGNFGAIRNVDTGEVLGFAPLFDFGSAFHEFKPDKDTNKPRFFEEELDRIVKEYIWMPELKSLMNNADLFKIIDMYPDLTASQKEAVKNGILKRTTRFEFIPVNVTERRKYEKTLEVDMDVLSGHSL